jgi:hypothetical protein
MKHAEIEYWRDQVKHHSKLEADQRNVADTYEKRYDNLIKTTAEKARKHKQGIIDDLTEYLDPLPADGQARKDKVASVAGMFELGLRDEINHLITRMEHEIARFPLTERETDFHRAGINFGHLLLEWGNLCINEHHANQAGDKATQDTFGTLSRDDESVETIKKKVE